MPGRMVPTSAGGGREGGEGEGRRGVGAEEREGGGGMSEKGEIHDGGQLGLSSSET